eukprot:g7068.t1
MKLIVALCSVLVLMLCSVHGQSVVPDEVLRLIEAQEAIVDRLAEEVVELFEDRLTYLRQCTCSRHSCSNDLSGFRCFLDLGDDPSFCGECEGRFLGFEASAFRTPPNTNIEDMSPRLKESICVYANLEPLIMELLEDDIPTWTYFGGVDGMMRIYPVSARTRGLENEDDLLGGCDQYDPRIRPWFIGASTRPKDIVFVMDASDTMNQPAGSGSDETRWDVTRGALISMLDTLASFDYVNVVTFADTATRLSQDNSLLQGTSENLSLLEELVDDVTPSGTSNFEAAFEEAFDILTSACEEGTESPTCSGCHRVIFFLTDGRDSSQNEGQSISPSTILDEIEGYQRTLERETSSRANIFTFSMGETADDSIPRQIACANNGSWSYIGPDTDVLTAMNSYYHFLTDSSTSNTTTWINPYEDAGGLGLITTVSRPVYSRGTDELDGVFLGVAAHDVLLSEIEADDVPYTDVLDEIILRSQSCGQTPQSLCQLQVHRNQYLDRAVCVDPITSSSSTTDDDDLLDRQRPCYRGPGKLYKLFHTPSSWQRGERLCRRDEGRLAVIENEEELAFVAGLSFPDGSWVGARRNGETDNMEWIDEDVSSETLEDSSPYWGLGEPNNLAGGENCVHIDRRGTIGNLNDASCRTELSFVCEYERGNRCNEITEVPEQGYFNVPPLSSCISEEEAIENSEPLNVARRLSTDDVLCPLRRPRDNFEVKCCPNCEEEG